MKQFILRFFGVDLKAITRKLIEKDHEIEDLKLEKQILETELLGKERLLAKKIAIVDATVGDPEPQGADRAGYVMQVANFYEGIGRKKLLHLIAATREDLDTVHQNLPPGMDRTRYDDYLRGTSNAMKFLMDWFELLSGEHKNNINQNSN
jgi:hypothetical protein